MSESTETTFNNVEPCTLATITSASHLSTVSEESHDAEEALSCSSTTTNEISEPIVTSDLVKNRVRFSKVNTCQGYFCFISLFTRTFSFSSFRYLTQEELLACNSGRAATEEERKRKIVELFKLPLEKLDNSITYAQFKLAMLDLLCLFHQTIIF